MTRPAGQVGKENQPCLDCEKPIGPNGAWWERPYAMGPYGLCPACHQRRWGSILAGNVPTKEPSP
jgi:hypothetical protein